MLFSVDFSIQLNGDFHTIHSAFIHAENVTECKKMAEKIKGELPENKHYHVHIFIGE
ncbi:hypothetical protein V7127_02435 [Bacillus sp. JJ1773]|uniref:hypothetical protein n=1 Tax=Bacillus sp. JJ1773 TaxID=3122965 RepID=UPI002FFECFF1